MADDRHPQQPLDRPHPGSAISKISHWYTLIQTTQEASATTTTTEYFPSEQQSGLLGIYFYEMHISRTCFVHLFMGDRTMTSIKA